MERRDFAKGIACAAFASRTWPTPELSAQSASRNAGAVDMPQSGPKLKVAMLLYPGLTLLDLIGPHTALAFSSDLHLVWKDTDPVMSDTGVEVKPTTAFRDCNEDLDILFVPGGPGTIPAMQDAEVLTFLRDHAKRAKYVTSVCTGSLILGAAGLLDGYKATSHWSTVDILPLFGAIPTEGRVVIDRNRMTGGGVTAGIDFGLTILARLRGDAAAETSQLAMEYDPQPPFQSGSPKKAPPAITAGMVQALATAHKEMEVAARNRKIP